MNKMKTEKKMEEMKTDNGKRKENLTKTQNGNG